MTSQASQLPVFEATRFEINDEDGSHTMLRVVCPRKACGGILWVPLTWGVIREVVGRSGDLPARPTGRPCPHCAKASHIPEEFRIYPEAPKKKKIVKLRRKK
jgi:hypothetical protein